MLGCALLAACWSVAATAETANSALSSRHRQLLIAADELAATVRDRVWPGWGGELEVLLVTEPVEILVGGSRLPPGFAATGDES